MDKWLNSVYTDGSKVFVSNPTPKKGEKISISMRVLKNNPIKSIFLRAKHNGVEVLHEMVKAYEKNNLVYYKTEIVYYEDVLAYLFYIATDKQIYYYNQFGITTYMPNEHYDFKIIYDYEQPSWVKGAVFYQIFPERFCNGNPKNDVVDNEYLFDSYPTIKMNWNDIPLDYSQAHCLDFYGGDLQGIKQKIPYLKKLGVSALYLNPIFRGATCHKYDCLDYFNVDEHFGGNLALQELIEELHKNNMKIILDVSINHTGTANKWFNKEGAFFDKTIGAYNNPDCPEREYYFFDEQNNYKSWLGTVTLPTLNYSSLALRKKIFLDQDSLVKKWIKTPYGIDGWRFDVADTMARNDYLQLHHEVWPQIRKSIKEENHDAYILCEDWTDSYDFLKGKEWDSTMNYFGFTRPMREFLGQGDLHSVRNPKLRLNYKMKAEDLINRFKQTLCQLPFVMQQNEFNLLDSHDVGRLHNDPNITYDDYVASVIAMFMMIGCPSIYYGDEVGIDGILTTEGCRYPMPWKEGMEDSKFYKLYSTLAKLKQNENALCDGGYIFMEPIRYTWGLLRFDLNNCFIFVMSTDDYDSQIKFDLEIIGFKNQLPEFDMFGTKVEYSLIEDEITVYVKPHSSILIKL